MSGDLGDVATWVGAVGTVGALFAALRQIKTEREARHKADRERDAQLHRAQAERVSAWVSSGAIPPDGGDWLVVLNRSDEPVYRAVVLLVLLQGSGPRRGEDYVGEHPPFDCFQAIGVLPPGRWRVRVTTGWRGMMRQPGAEIAFTDRSGNHWVRRATGLLEELQAESFTHYNIPLPIGLGPPEPFPETNQDVPA